MSGLACPWCHRFAGGHAERCLFPNSDQCDTERRKEDMAHAINDSLDSDDLWFARTRGEARRKALSGSVTRQNPQNGHTATPAQKTPQNGTESKDAS